MPSSGKSTLGKQLAYSLGYHFIDTDTLIEHEQDRSIMDIFRADGEAYFRQLESRVLRTLQPNSRLVVATGGGMPCFDNNMAYMNATGLSIYLDVSPERLVERMLSNSTNNRPLYDQKDPAILEKLWHKYEERHLIYSQALITVSDEASVERLLKHILPFLSGS